MKTDDIEGIHEQANRFSSKDMYSQLLDQKVLESLNQKDELIALIEESLTYKHKDNCYIHGDLGAWNMLFSGKDIYLIDFGEVRRGNNHFDIAAVLTSRLDLSHTEEEVEENLNALRSGYIEHFLNFDSNILKENIKLWILRGILAILIEYGVN